MFKKKELTELFNNYSVTWTNDISMYKYLSWIYTDRHMYANFFQSDDRILAMLEKFVEYHILGYITTNSEVCNDLLVDREPTKLFIIVNSNHTELFIATETIIPQLWYKIEHDYAERIAHIVSVYDHKDYDIKYETTVRYFLGNSNEYDDVDKIHDYFILNNFTEVLLHGSAWKTYPEKLRESIQNRNIGPREFNKMCLYAERQTENSYSISTHSIYSKSKIKFEDNNGTHILQISYNPIVNKSIDVINNIKDTNYPDDVPVDLLMVLEKFGCLLTYRDLLNKENLDRDLIESAISLSHYNEKAQHDIIKILTERRQTADSIMKSLLKKYCIFLSSNLEISTIINSEMFERFIEKLRCSNIVHGDKVNKIVDKIYEIGSFDKKCHIVNKNIKDMADYIVSIIT